MPGKPPSPAQATSQCQVSHGPAAPGGSLTGRGGEADPLSRERGCTTPTRAGKVPVKALARGQRAEDRAGQDHTQERGKECEDRAVPGVGRRKGSQRSGAVPGRGWYQQMMQGLGKTGMRGWGGRMDKREILTRSQTPGTEKW